MPTFRFSKMHGLGNDFVVINGLAETIDLSSKTVAALAQRHTGIGFDQLLIIEPAKQADFFCRIFNADGSEAEQCGNGLRCIARYVHEEKLHPHTHFQLETKAGIFPVTITDYDHIRITLGVPHIQAKSMALDVTEQTVNLSVLSVGNPHAVMKVDDVKMAPLGQLGPIIATHTAFPNGTNVGFMQVINPHHIHLRTYERGAGETCACGSNACAAAVTGIANGWLNSRVEVTFEQGSLWIEWEGEGKPIHMTGPAARIFDGVL